MSKYEEVEKLNYVRGAYTEAVEYIREEASVTESRAEAWIQKYWRSINRGFSFGQLIKEKNELKIKLRKFKGLDKRLEICQELLLDGCTNDRKKRRELAKKAVNKYGHPISRACKVLNISEGYYRSLKDD